MQKPIRQGRSLKFMITCRVSPEEFELWKALGATKWLRKILKDQKRGLEK